MWLLLVAAGTGYLARCWQKARKFKSGSRVFKHITALNVSQRSPSCTPRRGRSTTSSRRGLRKRSQSAKGVNRKLLPGRKEGRLARTHADENLGLSNKFFEELLLGEDFSEQCVSALKDQDTPCQVQNHYQVSCLHVNNFKEPCLSLSSMCVRDDWRDTSLCMEKALLFTAEDDAKEHIERDHTLSCTGVLPNKKPIFGILHGFPATTLDLVKDQLVMVASSPNSCLNFSKSTVNSALVSDINSQLVHAVPCPQILRIKTMGERNRQSCPFKFKESTEQAFGNLAKMARELGHRTCSIFTSRFSNRKFCLKPDLLQNTKEVSVCEKLSYEKPRNAVPMEEKREKHGLGDSHLLKALLDPMFLDQCHRCNHLTNATCGHDLENAVACLTDNTGLSMATNPDGDSKTSTWKHSKGQALVFPKPSDPSVKLTSDPSCGRRNFLLSSNEGSLVALGVAMGLLFVATGRKSEFEALHEMLRKTNLMIEELKKQFDFRLESDPLKLPEVEKHNEKVPSTRTMADGTCPWEPHLHPDACESTAERSSLTLFIKENTHMANTENNVHGLNDLEAELEAELQLMEMNVYNTDLIECEWNQTQSNKKSWQSEGEDNVYGNIDIRDPMPVLDVDQPYESDFVVSPSELERRLWRVLEERHEERICELENDLHIIHEKFIAKEVEIQWWKDRVWWLMETSLGGKQDNLQSLFTE